MEKPEIKVGTLVITDGRAARGGCFEKLVESDWEKAEFRLMEPKLGRDVAVNVKVTGKTVRYDAPKLGGVPLVRVQVTFVGDGEPDEKVGGWVYAAFVGK